MLAVSICTRQIRVVRDGGRDEVKQELVSCLYINEATEVVLRIAPERPSQE